MSEKRLELFHDYSETGFDGKYERTTYYTLIVGDGNRNATVTLEVQVDKRTFPDGPESQSNTSPYPVLTGAA